MGSIELVDPLCRSLANAAKAVVLSVGYRLAPENPFPAALHDCYATLEWTQANLTHLSVKGAPIAVAGESAGANLAAATCLLARDQRGPPIRHQLLLCPALDRRFDTPTYRRYGEGYWLTRSTLEWCWTLYLDGIDDLSNGYACPLRASQLGGLPPASVVTAEYDPLRDDGEAYANRLIGSGVPVRLHRYAGMIHGFITCAGVLTSARLAIKRIGHLLRAELD